MEVWAGLMTFANTGRALLAQRRRAFIREEYPEVVEFEFWSQEGHHG